MEIKKNIKKFCIRILFCLAKAAIWVVGSEPIDSRQTNGVRGSDSSQVNSKSNICISLYSGPKDSKQNHFKQHIRDRN